MEKDKIKKRHPDAPNPDEEGDEYLNDRIDEVYELQMKSLKNRTIPQPEKKHD